MFSFAVTRSGSLSATPQATTVTGSGAAAGLYLFSNLLPGEYVVKVAASNFTSSGVLQSYVSSSGNSTTGDDNTPTIHNFARTGTATQSTPNAFNGVMTNPIDGNTDGRTWSHTDGSANPWWRVDFSTPGTINQIVIWNRTDCCPERLNNALVELLNASGTVVWSGNVAANAPTTSTFNVGGVYGSAVRVSLTGSVALSLAEVQVFGVIDDEDGVTLPAFTRSTTVNVPVVVSGAAASAKLNAFFDWNADGDFMDAGEALTERTVNNGSNTLPVPVPANAAGAVNLGARFRLSTAGGLTATGAANDGEIEDYLVQLSCPTITNPSTAAPLCQGATGSNLTVSANTNTANSIRFVRFTTDQMAGTSPTTTEAANIYAGTAVATVTPTGAASPYTATLTAATAGWSGLAPGTYYVYAILNPDLGASCRPVQEMVVVINPPPALTVTNSAICAGSSLDLATLVTSSGGGTLTYYASTSDAQSGSNAFSSSTVRPASTTTYYVRSMLGTGCYSTAAVTVTVHLPPVLAVTNGSVCLGGSINLATLVTNTGNGTLSYFLTRSGADMATGALAAAVVTPSAATNYYIRSTDANGCFTVREAVVNIQAPNCTNVQVTGPH